MANQAMFSEFTGFTVDDVEQLCKQFDMPLDKMALWYDGYRVGKYDIYNPQSVVRAVTTGIFDSYWTKTETFEALQMYIKLNMDGLRQSVIRMIAGEHIFVNTGKFQNDMVSLNSADDVLTLLIHLGYLTYDFDTKTAWIPNKEVRQEFINCIEDGGWEEVMNSLRQYNELLSATLNSNGEKAAEILEEVHRKNISIIAYNNEMSLSVTLALAYYSARNSYEIFRELPSGNGFADLTFIPKKGVDLPAMAIELKYNKSADQKNNEDVILITAIYSAKEAASNSAASNKCYAEFPTVPDFGAVIGAKPIEKTKGIGSWTYIYDSKTVTKESITEYNDLLLAAGFFVLDYKNKTVTYDSKKLTLYLTHTADDKYKITIQEWAY